MGTANIEIWFSKEEGYVYHMIYGFPRGRVATIRDTTIFIAIVTGSIKRQDPTSKLEVWNNPSLTDFTRIGFNNKK